MGQRFITSIAGILCGVVLANALWVDEHARIPLTILAVILGFVTAASALSPDWE